MNREKEGEGERRGVLRNSQLPGRDEIIGYFSSGRKRERRSRVERRGKEDKAHNTTGDSLNHRMKRAR